MESELARFTAVESRFREVIRSIVQRRASHGVLLSWRLMFEIEDEVMNLLWADPELEADYLRMMAAPSTLADRRTDEPVNLQDLGAMHTVLWMIQEAYYHPY